MVSDVPIEILITVGAGIVLLFTVCIVALLVRHKCQQADLNNQAIYNQSTVSSSGGYATTKPHTRSSWTCTYKAGHHQQVNTHIWETPLPEPSADEYTLSTSMRPSHDNTPIPAALLDSMEYTVPISSASAQGDNSPPQAEYTKPVKTPGHTDNMAGGPLSDKRHSQINYYYYDPSSGDQTEYMAPATAIDQNQVDSSPHQITLQGNSNDINDGLTNSSSAHRTKECDYRTLIRLDNSSK